MFQALPIKDIDNEICDGRRGEELGQIPFIEALRKLHVKSLDNGSF